MDSRIDPVTRDYVVTSTGGLEGAEPHRNAVLIALTVEKGSVPGEPELGSTLHELRASKLLPALLPRARDLVRQAMKPLETEGITLLEVDAALEGAGLALQVHYQVGRTRYTFAHFVRVS